MSHESARVLCWAMRLNTAHLTVPVTLSSLWDISSKIPPRQEFDPLNQWLATPAASDEAKWATSCVQQKILLDQNGKHTYGISQLSIGILNGRSPIQTHHVTAAVPIAEIIWDFVLPNGKLISILRIRASCTAVPKEIRSQRRNILHSTTARENGKSEEKKKAGCDKSPLFYRSSLPLYHYS